MKKIFWMLSVFALLAGFSSCNKDENGEENEEPQLILKLKFDPDQVRYDAQGNIAVLPDTHAAQTPDFQGMSMHYVELTPNAYTLPGEGFQIFKGETKSGVPTVNIDGFDLAPIDFSKAIVKDEGEIFYSIPLSSVPAGTYPYLRASVTYQKYEIKFKAAGINNLTATVASFVGYGQYIEDLPLYQGSIAVNATKTQGFWAFEEHSFGTKQSGQAPPGATTVPNPLFNTSAIAEGSCLVTGVFPEAFTVTGNETEDIVLTLSFSVNDSFEWHDVVADGIYEPEQNEDVVDMGLRGLIPTFE